jgi:hypothetical protein
VRPRASILIVPLQVVVLVGGLLLVSRLSGSYLRALILGALWMVVAALAFGKAAKTWAPRMRAPVRIVSLLVGLGIAGWVAYSTLHTTSVNEKVVTGVSPAAAAAATAGAAPSMAVNVASGQFSQLAEGSARGTATVVRLPSGGDRLTLTDFKVSAGPDLRVYLATAGESGRGAVGAHKDLGPLKGERGNQQYVVPAGTDLTRYSVVLIYCRSFSVGFARAPLRHA